MSAILTGPTIRRGTSEQSVETPPEFMRAVELRFGKPKWDLAASLANSKCGPSFYGPGSAFSENALAMPWHKLHGLLWLNPPYANISTWASTCASESKRGAEILFLVPGSIGANWYWRFVEPFASVYSVGRMKFVGHKDPYPKDLILCHYFQGVHLPMQRWRWESL